MEDEETPNLFRVHRTLMAMLSKRAYAVPQNQQTMSLDEFKQTYGEHTQRQNLDSLYSRIDDPSARLLCYFARDPKVSSSEILSCTNAMKEHNVDHAIIIYKEKVTPMAKQQMKLLCESEKFSIEPFSDSQLYVDITEHQLVPQHVILTTEEKTELLRRYRIKDVQLPRIKLEDPIAQFYGMRRGQVVKIIRPSETAGRYITYRFVM